MVIQSTLILFGSFFAMLLVGVPISAGIGLASIVTAFSTGIPADKIADSSAVDVFHNNIID